MKFLWTFLMTLTCLMTLTSATQNFETLKHLKPQTTDAVQTKAAQDLIGRIAKERAAEFMAVVKQTNQTKDEVTLKFVNGKLEITGTTGVAVSMGFYYYLTNYCKCQFTWGGEQMNIPQPLPMFPGGASVTVRTNDQFRYYQNVCTPSYSFVWYKWSDWERQIDWMALHSINMPLAFTGQEAIFQRVYMNLGFSFEEVQDHFSGPAFLSWSRMGNFHGWGGPLPQQWINNQLILQHKILDRVRSLGMTAVLPGFGGHVPNAIVKRYPNASVSRLPNWCHFNQSYCCVYLLDFQDPLYKVIGKAVIREMINEFGTDHIYNIDSFNEMTPKSGNASYLTNASRLTYEMIQEEDNAGIWMMQGWLFQSPWWNKERAKSYLTGVPTGKMIVLDLYSEVSPVWQKFESYYGQPYIWCMLHNFGGTLEMYGALQKINVGPFQARTSIGGTMVGIGMTPEGIYQNEVVYEFFSENAWRSIPTDITHWISNYTLSRYGKTDKLKDLAWQLLKSSVYNDDGSFHDNGHDIIISRPSSNLNPKVWYKSEDLFAAWDLLSFNAVEYANSSLFRYDLVDVTRNSLMLIMTSYYHDMMQAYVNNETNDVVVFGNKISELLSDLDRVLGSDPHFLLGKWIAAAKSQVTSISYLDDIVLYERNARNQITLWGPRGEIRDYASKQWSGLVNGYYAPRWNLFINSLTNCSQKGTTFDQNQYNKQVFSAIEEPFTYALNEYPVEPVGDASKIVSELNTKYRPESRSTFLRSLPNIRNKSPKYETDWMQNRYGEGRIVVTLP